MASFSGAFLRRRIVGASTRRKLSALSSPLNHLCERNACPAIPSTA
jgi:hypothetical protein